jgi:integrase
MRAVMRFAVRKLNADAPALTKVESYRLENRGARIDFIEPEEWQRIVGAFDDDEAWRVYLLDKRHLGPFKEETGRRHGGGLKSDSDAANEYRERMRREMRKIETLLYSGQRLGDVLSLQTEAIDFERNQITWRPAKTGRKPVVIPMGPRLRQIMQEHATKPGYVWGEGDSKGAQRRVQRALRVACKVAGVRVISPHRLRKTFGSWLARDGQSLRVIQELLAHADPTITARHYAHLVPGNLSGPVARLEEIAAGKVAR